MISAEPELVLLKEIAGYHHHMKKWKLLETTYPQKAERRKHLLNAAQKFQFIGVRSYILMAQRTQKGQHYFGGDIRSGQKTA